MDIKTQISIFLENKPGALDGVMEEFSKRNINVEAIMVSEAADHAVVRIIVDQPETAIHALGEAGLLVIDTQVACISLENKPGKLKDLTKTFIDNGIELEYAYGSNSADGSIIIIKVKQLEKLKNLNIT